MNEIDDLYDDMVKEPKRDTDKKRAIRSTGDPNEHEDRVSWPWKQAVEVKSGAGRCTGCDPTQRGRSACPLCDDGDAPRFAPTDDLAGLAAHTAGLPGEQAKQALSAEAKTVAELRRELEALKRKIEEDRQKINRARNSLRSFVDDLLEEEAPDVAFAADLLDEVLATGDTSAEG